ncbi:hypothetical protein [Methanobrevibacter ruminantium]|uniref:hypothetical protein n=1 Tax=Methanobrevibacter ruminantium TaxID=83816 RepID=UPI0026EAABAF|nr:hypothetical protein [Methanobrevibacter ruminantium]
MTSELVILTPSAVALAADSAVTLDNRKIYNGINKLFMLSNEPPIGIMTYNNTRFLNIPFETIIKEFRLYSNNEKFESLNDFQNGLNEYLKFITPKSDFKFSFDQKLEDFIANFNSINDLDEDLYQRMINFATPNDNITIEIYNSFTQEDLEKTREKLKEISETYKLKEDYDIFIENFIKFFIWEKFVNNFTGIVLAGFERDKLFPSSIEYKIIYLYDEKFITCAYGENEVSLKKDGDVVVNSFAQSDVISTFLHSIDFNTKSQILNFFSEINANYANKLIEMIQNNENIDDDSKQEVLKEIDNFNENNVSLNMEFVNFIQLIENRHVAPILRSIGALPYEELSNLCESLIKITSLKRKVQSDLETVGGDVDVAIITKGDGFIWTKRKHYFDGNLNHQFFEKKNNEKL